MLISIRSKIFYLFQRFTQDGERSIRKWQTKTTETDETGLQQNAESGGRGDQLRQKIINFYWQEEGSPKSLHKQKRCISTVEMPLLKKFTEHWPLPIVKGHFAFCDHCQSTIPFLCIRNGPAMSDRNYFHFLVYFLSLYKFPLSKLHLHISLLSKEL